MRKTVVLFMLLLASCGRSFTEEPIGLGEANMALDPAFAPPPPADLSPYLTPEPTEYHVQAGDRLDVSVESVPELSRGSLLVRPDGRITMPLAGEIEVGGLSTAEAAARISKALSRYVRRSSVLVGLAEAQGRRLLVLALAMAGGVAGATAGGGLAADLDRSYLLRGGRIVPIRIDRLLAGDLSQNIFVQGDDMLYLQPRGDGEVIVLGEVGGPTVVPADSRLTLLKALALAGGITRDAKDSAVRVIRGSLLEPKVYLADFQDIVAGLSRDVHLLPGDVVFVTTTELSDWNYLLNQLIPTLQAALTTRYLIEGPNGLIFQGN
jgi:polysaccharide export outer membrane protein